MIKINIHEAKVHLSRYLPRLARGEVIVLCKRNEPVAEIRGIPQARKSPRPVGLDKARLKIPKGFHDPLPADLLDAFEGR